MILAVASHYTKVCISYNKNMSINTSRNIWFMGFTASKMTVIFQTSNRYDNIIYKNSDTYMFWCKRVGAQHNDVVPN